MTDRACLERIFVQATGFTRRKKAQGNRYEYCEEEEIRSPLYKSHNAIPALQVQSE